MALSTEAIEAMRHAALWGGLPEHLLTMMLDYAKIVDVPVGTVLIRQGTEGDAAYVVLTGMLQVVVETAFGDVAMAEVGPRQIVGEIAVFTELKRTATVRAQVDSTVLCLGREAFNQIILLHPGAALGVIEALAQRVNALNKPLAMLSLAVHALEKDNLSSTMVASMLTAMDDDSPFAQSFHKVLIEMEKKNALRQEMEFAARLQQSILPRVLDFGGESSFRVGAFMRPARDVGGDFYDCFMTEDGRAVMVVADVSGKGIPASLFMAVSHTLLRATVQSAVSLEEALAHVNAQLDAQNDEGLFVTIFVTELDLKTGGVRYVNAGHCDGYVRRANGVVETLCPTGPAIAMAPRKKFRAETIQMEPGDLLFVTSDGVTEAFAADGDMFGEERLISILQGLAQRDVDSVLAEVDRQVIAFANGCEQSDDITCLALSCG